MELQQRHEKLLENFLNDSPFYVYFNMWIKCLGDFSEVVDIDIEDNGDGTVNIYYTVADAGDYTFSIKFGGQPVPDGFYTFTVIILYTYNILNILNFIYHKV